MSDFKERVYEEVAELNEKTGRLINFMHGEVYAGLDAVDQGLLMVQIRAMHAYSDVLHERIDRFEAE